ncbi:MAG: heterodisulfide reductase-related iron-sulfur binding cluster [Pirellulales bacterium]
MLHKIPTDKIGPRADAMAQAVQTCVHCGFCLPNCPTYQVLGQESDSPRGRILLMKHVLEGNLQAEEIQPHIDRCLGCLACETNCPSGVPYSSLLSPYRDLTRDQGKRSFSLKRLIALETIPYPERFRWAIQTGKFAKAFAWMIPRSLRPMLDLLPENVPEAVRSNQEVFPAQGLKRGRVALLEGCAQRVLDPAIHQAALRVLTRNGIEVVVPKNQGCCGALAWHVGYGNHAMDQARHNMQVFPEDVDAILSTAAGCGSAMHEYPVLFQRSADENQARAFASKCKDVLTYLDSIGIEAPPPIARPLRVAYHDACHLAHAQKETRAPRRLLALIPNLTMVPLTNSDLCCGSAGTYNMDQPEIAHELGQKKAKTIVDSSCDFVALANIGCEVQIAIHLQKLGATRPVLHVIQVLDAAYQRHQIA